MNLQSHMIFHTFPYKLTSWKGCLKQDSFWTSFVEVLWLTSAFIFWFFDRSFFNNFPGKWLIEPSEFDPFGPLKFGKSSKANQEAMWKIGAILDPTCENFFNLICHWAALTGTNRALPPTLHPDFPRCESKWSKFSLLRLLKPWEVKLDDISQEETKD